MKLTYNLKLLVLLGSLPGFAMHGSVYAEAQQEFSITEFHKIIDAIDESEISEQAKQRLFRDMKHSMIENVRMADIPEPTKQRLIRELSTMTR